MRPAFAVALVAICLAGCKPHNEGAKDASTQFDLQCDGTSGTVGPNAGASERYSSHFRVDLDAGLWCRDKCETILKIQKVEPGRITFSDTMNHDGLAPRGGSVEISVNRITGELVDMFVIGQDVDLTKATCVRAPFSRLPVKKF